MANFQTHLSVAATLGAAYGAAGAWYGHLEWGPVFLGAGLTSCGRVSCLELAEKPGHRPARIVR